MNTKFITMNNAIIICIPTQGYIGTQGMMRGYILVKGFQFFVHGRNYLTL